MYKDYFLYHVDVEGLTVLVNYLRKRADDYIIALDEQKYTNGGHSQNTISEDYYRGAYRALEEVLGDLQCVIAERKAGDPINPMAERAINDLLNNIKIDEYLQGKEE